jgi:hypothetical protein
MQGKHNAQAERGSDASWNKVYSFELKLLLIVSAVGQKPAGGERMVAACALRDA